MSFGILAMLREKEQEAEDWKKAQNRQKCKAFRLEAVLWLIIQRLIGRRLRGHHEVVPAPTSFKEAEQMFQALNCLTQSLGLGNVFAEEEDHILDLLRVKGTLEGSPYQDFSLTKGVSVIASLLVREARASHPASEYDVLIWGPLGSALIRKDDIPPR